MNKHISHTLNLFSTDTAKSFVKYNLYSNFLALFALTAKILNQGYRYHKLRKAFSKFYKNHFNLVSKFNVGLKSLLQQGLPELELYGDLVYKLQNICLR